MREILRDVLATGAIATIAVIGARGATEHSIPSQEFSGQSLHAVLPPKDSTKINDPRLVSKVPKKIQ